MTNLEAPDILRIYDGGIKSWLTNAIKLDKKVIPNVIASPEKVFGEMTRIQGLDNKKFRPILPFISITRVAVTRDPNRYNRNDIRGFVDESEANSTLVTRYPVPVSIEYQFDVWMNFQDHANKILQAFELEFNHPTYVQFTIDSIMQDKICYFNLDTINDTTTLEPIAEQNRIFRNSYNCALNAWMYYGYTPINTIGSWQFDLYTAKTIEADMNTIDENEWTLEMILTGG